MGLVICENFKPASLVLPANRSTDTHLTKAQISLPQKIRERLWSKTINAKTLNQLSLATLLSPSHPRLQLLEMTARGKKEYKEALCAKMFWEVFGDTIAETDDFKRGRSEGSLNPLLNYGYAVLLSTVLQNCFALGIDPTFGIYHAVRERSTPLAYDLMEPFRPCVDWRVAQWVKKHPNTTDWEVTHEFRKWVTGFPTVTVDYFDLQLDIRSCIEGVIRSFRKAIIKQQSVHYKPWTQQNSKWAG